MLNIALFGPPGAGKGTQSEKLIARYGLFHISTGDMLRKEIASGSDLGKKIDEVISAGHLVSDELIMSIIRKTLAENPHEKGILLDGFPRTLSQAALLEELFDELHLPFFGILSLDVPREELLARIVNRGKTSHRNDDNEAVFEERLREYEQKTLPVARYFEKKGKYHVVSGTGTLDEIFERLVRQIERQIEQK
ncbi:adenylate kinase [bacterium]|nr:adenylate kinase [bacterium]